MHHKGQGFKPFTLFFQIQILFLDTYHQLVNIYARLSETTLFWFMVESWMIFNSWEGGEENIP